MGSDRPRIRAGSAPVVVLVSLLIGAFSLCLVVGTHQRKVYNINVYLICGTEVDTKYI